MPTLNKRKKILNKTNLQKIQIMIKIFQQEKEKFKKDKPKIMEWFKHRSRATVLKQKMETADFKCVKVNMQIKLMIKQSCKEIKVKKKQVRKREMFKEIIEWLPIKKLALNSFLK